MRLSCGCLDERTKRYYCMKHHIENRLMYEKDKWFGNNGNDLTVKEFENGWNDYRKDKETKYKKTVDGEEAGYDYNAGIKAAIGFWK